MTGARRPALLRADPSGPARTSRSGYAIRAALATALTAAAAVAATAAGCGGGVKAPDLFLVERTGGVTGAPGARLTLLVDEEGGVRCDGGPKRKLSDPQIVQARAIQEELSGPAGAHMSLPARPGSVFGYYVRDESGTVRFADNSPGQPKVLRNLALFVLQVAQQNCHLSD